jgi:pimeloyl-ACP methyl ester carboxylesterase
MLDILLLAAVAIPTFEPKPCSGEAASDRSVVCGDVHVPENRERSDGRMIDINVVILKARAPVPDLPPLVDIDGGPGLAATRSAAFYRSDGLAYRARRDVILVDQRGTGQSNPLACPELSLIEAQLVELYPAKQVAACRATLEQRADLGQYGTDAAADDLDDVRRALGHAQLDIVALSYGTTMAMRYMAKYPSGTRAAVLLSLVPADAMPPQHHAVVADAMLDRIFSDCAADAACKAAFPDLAGDVGKAIRWLGSRSDGPSPEIFFERLRTWLYAPVTARRVPLILHRAAAHDLEPFKAMTAGAGSMPYFDGLYLSITCSESIALMDVDRAAEASRATRFGDYRLRRQREACAAWPKATVSPDFLTPAASDAAILMISGGRDPVTPARWAIAAQRHFPNARHIEMPWSGHSFEGLTGIDSCYDPMLLRFFDTGDAQSLDISCIEGMRPPPFATAGD